MSTGTTTPIERTPNIGANLAAELRSVGIDSLEALMRVGLGRLAAASSRESGAQQRPGLPRARRRRCRRPLESPAPQGARGHPPAREGGPRMIRLGAIAALAALALAACGKSEAPKVDAATERAEATERAKQRAYGGTEVKALEKANQMGADINKQAQDRDPDK